MAKSYAKRTYEQTYVSSLLAVQSRREETQLEGMSLNDFYLNLGKAAKRDYENGLITYQMFLNRVAELKSQYNTLKNRAA